MGIWLASQQDSNDNSFHLFQVREHQQQIKEFEQEQNEKFEHVEFGKLNVPLTNRKSLLIRNIAIRGEAEFLVSGRKTNLVHTDEKALSPQSATTFPGLFSLS